MKRARPSARPVPDDMLENVQKWRTLMVEKICELDDDLGTKYLEDPESVNVPEMKLALRAGTISRRLLSRPLRRPPQHRYPAPPRLRRGLSPQSQREARGRGHRPPRQGRQDDAPPLRGCASPRLVFKVVSDQHGDLTYMPSTPSIKKGDRLVNPGNGKREIASRIFEMHAQNRIPLDEVTAGNIVAVVGIKDSYTGDTLCDPDEPIMLERMFFPEPVIAMSIEPKTQDDKRSPRPSASSAARTPASDQLQRRNRRDHHRGHGRAPP